MEHPVQPLQYVVVKSSTQSFESHSKAKDYWLKKPFWKKLCRSHDDDDVEKLQ